MRRKTGIKLFTAVLLATAIVPSVFARPKLGICGGIILEEEPATPVAQPLAPINQTPIGDPQ